MTTVAKCQLLAAAGRWINPEMTGNIMGSLVGSINPLEVGAVQNVLMPLVGFHNGSSSADNKCDNKTVAMIMLLPRCLGSNRCS
jgi:hypothetical protein